MNSPYLMSMSTCFGTFTPRANLPNRRRWNSQLFDWARSSIALHFSNWFMSLAQLPWSWYHIFSSTFFCPSFQSSSTSLTTLSPVSHVPFVLRGTCFRITVLPGWGWGIFTERLVYFILLFISAECFSIPLAPTTRLCALVLILCMPLVRSRDFLCLPRPHSFCSFLVLSNKTRCAIASWITLLAKDFFPPRSIAWGFQLLYRDKTRLQPLSLLPLYSLDSKPCWKQEPTVWTLSGRIFPHIILA